MEPILQVKGLAKRFGPVEVLRGIDLALAAGEVLAVLGENGAGKSTLVRILSGVHADYDGEILLSGRAVRFAGTRDAERAGIAIIHQELNLVPELTVAENIFLGREPLRAGLFIDRRTMRHEARILMRRLGLTVNPGAKVASLRIGEQQLVEIAKALSLEARVLIMDEPTSALSPAECDLLFAVVRELRRQGVAVVYISHRMDEIFRLADRVMVLRDGRHVRTAPIGELGRKELIQLMVGRELAEHGLDPAPPQQDVILSVRNLGLAVARRGGGWRHAVENLSFDLHRGEILGIAGLLGAGRTEILETLFGAARGRRSGEVTLAGRPVTIRGPEDAKRAGMALVTEDRKFNGLLLRSDIRANTALPSSAELAWLGLARPARERRLAESAVARLRVRCTGIGQLASSLSGGNQQKVVIGKWLATGPRVLLLDEPTRGIDVGAKREIYDLLLDLAARGIGIVLVSSELPELLALCHRILVMCEGRATGTLDRAGFDSERIMELAARPSAQVAA